MGKTTLPFAWNMGLQPDTYDPSEDRDVGPRINWDKHNSLRRLPRRRAIPRVRFPVHHFTLLLLVCLIQQTCAVQSTLDALLEAVTADGFWVTAIGVALCTAYATRTRSPPTEDGSQPTSAQQQFKHWTNAARQGNPTHIEAQEHKADLIATLIPYMDLNRLTARATNDPDEAPPRHWSSTDTSAGRDAALRCPNNHRHIRRRQTWRADQKTQGRHTRCDTCGKTSGTQRCRICHVCSWAECKPCLKKATQEPRESGLRAAKLFLPCLEGGEIPPTGPPVAWDPPAPYHTLLAACSWDGGEEDDTRLWRVAQKLKLQPPQQPQLQSRKQRLDYFKQRTASLVQALVKGGPAGYRLGPNRHPHEGKPCETCGLPPLYFQLMEAINIVLADMKV